MIETIPFTVHEIETSSFHPLIKGQVDGVDVLLILDTGASRTVIDRSIVSEIPIMPKGHKEPYAAGINAQKIAVEQIEIPVITLGEVVFEKLKAFSSNLEPISKLYEELAGEKIHGLLGCDFLVENRAVVNFKTLKIQLHRKDKKILQI